MTHLGRKGTQLVAAEVNSREKNHVLSEVELREILKNKECTYMYIMFV